MVSTDKKPAQRTEGNMDLDKPHTTAFISQNQQYMEKKMTKGRTSEKQKITPQIGQIWRDTFGTKGKYKTQNDRTIEITDISSDDRVTATVLTGVYGEVVDPPRKTTLSIKTLHCSYELMRGS